MYKVFQYIFVLAIIGLVTGCLRGLFRRRSRSDSVNVVFLFLFYLCFWLGLLYHVLLTYLTSGTSATPGWYLYSVVVAEVILLFCGLFNLSRANWQRGVIGTILVLFCLLDLYTVFFVLLPYYTGLISHRVTGGLVSFDPFILATTSVKVMLSRLSVNKAVYMCDWYFLGVVLIFFGLTVLTLAHGFRLFGKEIDSEVLPKIRTGI